MFTPPTFPRNGWHCGPPRHASLNLFTTWARRASVFYGLKAFRRKQSSQTLHPGSTLPSIRKLTLPQIPVAFSLGGIIQGHRKKGGAKTTFLPPTLGPGLGHPPGGDSTCPGGGNGGRHGAGRGARGGAGRAGRGEVHVMLWATPALSAAPADAPGAAYI